MITQTASIADVIVGVADAIFFTKVQASCLPNRLFESKSPILTSGMALHKKYFNQSAEADE
jgi:hypothetical protein